MKVLIISLDKNLLGMDESFGDAEERHRLYGQKVSSIDIIVLNKNISKKHRISDNVIAYPTNSSSLFYFFWDAYKKG